MRITLRTLGIALLFVFGLLAIDSARAAYPDRTPAPAETGYGDP